jgi:hypothetical protein
MKFVIIFCCLIFVYLPIGISLAGDEESESLDEKKIWNLLKDLKDHSAGRLKIWRPESGIIEVPSSDADYVTLRTISDDPNVQSDFSISFPLPDSSKIEMVVIEMDFKWPSSKGGFQLTFGQNTSMFSGKGVSLSYQPISGIRVGKLSGTGSEVTTSSLSAMGTGSHSLKIVYKDNVILVTFDKKVISWAGSVTPNVITLTGDEFEAIQVTRFQASIKMKN